MVQYFTDIYDAVSSALKGMGVTVKHLWRLSRLGCSPDAPDMRQAIDKVCGQMAAEEGSLKDLGALRVAAWGGWEGDGALRKGAQELADKIASLVIGRGCPWHDAGRLPLVGW